MATIIGGIGTSHVPTIAMAYDRGKRNDPDWTPLFKGYEPVAQWLARRRPDVLVFFYNRHLRPVSHLVKPTRASDHHVLVAEFEFAEK